jgi:hypothetical protein
MDGFELDGRTGDPGESVLVRSNALFKLCPHPPSTSFRLSPEAKLKVRPCTSSHVSSVTMPAAMRQSLYRLSLIHPICQRWGRLGGPWYRRHLVGRSQIVSGMSLSLRRAAVHTRACRHYTALPGLKVHLSQDRQTCGQGRSRAQVVCQRLSTSSAVHPAADCSYGQASAEPFQHRQKQKQACGPSAKLAEWPKNDVVGSDHTTMPSADMHLRPNPLGASCFAPVDIDSYREPVTCQRDHDCYGQ